MDISLLISFVLILNYNQIHSIIKQYTSGINVIEIYFLQIVMNRYTNQIFKFWIYWIFACLI